jgi:catechol 2,3-dioxygenase-like lactoylglutathione lyase family enzyme
MKRSHPGKTRRRRGEFEPGPGEPVPLHRLTSIRLGVPDLEAACAFYRDPCGNFVEYDSDRDVIEDAHAWEPHDGSDRLADALAVWGPPVPLEFFAPPDIPAGA